MPGICDPGEDIARSVKSEGIDIICIPGACAANNSTVFQVDYHPLVLYLKDFFLERKFIGKNSFRDK